MGTELKIRNPKTGEVVRAYVSHFIFEEGKLSTIVNIKKEATAEALIEAHMELDRFLVIVIHYQKAGKATEFNLRLSDDEEMSFADIDVQSVTKMAVGPKGSVALGFDEELIYTTAEIDQTIEDLIAENPSNYINQNPERPQSIINNKKWWQFWK